ncbi:MAG: IPTL-CTERM sorting domain-containing protein [Burkholderiaceae bacterium]
MRHSTRVALAGVLAAVGSALAFSAHAGTASVVGTVDASSPTMSVVLISPPNCLTQSGTIVGYRTHPFSVTLDGTYALDVDILSGNSSIYLYENAFDPSNGTVNCVAADNSAPIGISYLLSAANQYIAVVFDDTFAQPGTTYRLTIDGPGNILIAVASAGPIAVPTLSAFGLMGLSGLIAGAAAMRARRRA